MFELNENSHHHNHNRATIGDVPVLRYLKEPVWVISELYNRYPDGGQFGWYAFVHNKGTFAYWHVHNKKWELISGYNNELNTEPSEQQPIIQIRRKKFKVNNLIRFKGIVLFANTETFDASDIRLRVFRFNGGTIQNFYVPNTIKNVSPSFVDDTLAKTANFNFPIIKVVNDRGRLFWAVDFSSLCLEFNKIKKINHLQDSVYIGRTAPEDPTKYTKQKAKGLYFQSGAGTATSETQLSYYYNLTAALVKNNRVISNYIKIKPYFNIIDNDIRIY